jgi:hypothetical protein
MKTIAILFVALISILVVSPKILNNIYNSILGRIVLISMIIFVSMNNVTLGLLMALVIIVVSNNFSPFVEGMETIGEDNTSSVGTKLVVTKKKAQEDLGIDKEDIKNAIASKSSKTIPLDPSIMKSDEVAPSEPTTLQTINEAFANAASRV